MNKNTVNPVENMCRTCMAQFPKTRRKIDNKKQSIHEVPTGSKNETSIMELLQLVQPQIKVEIEDHLPTLICSDCVRKLLISHEFIETYTHVDEKFRKMLEEVDIDCKYEFNDLEEPLKIVEEKNCTVEMVEKDEIHEITKFELEIEQVDLENLEKEEENENDWPKFEDELLQEMSDHEDDKEPVFINPYSDASDNEWTPLENRKKDSPKKTITRKRKSGKINDRTTNSNSAKNTKRKTVKKRKQNTDELPLPVENEDGRVQCQQCESVLDNIKLWHEHVQQHQPKETPKRKNVKKSDKIKKEKSNQKEYKCEHCGKGFASISYYRIHKRIHSGDQPFLCTECGKGFKVNSSLYTHMLRHKGVKKYQCPQCPKKFVCSSGLYGHMLVHTNKKPFVCDTCGSAFRMAYELKKHNRNHNGIKSFECEYCDKKFITREKQLRHVRTHTGEKPYRCKYCERAFAQSNDCVKHLRQHLGDNVYQCELCPLRFPLARDLRAHFATHKGDDEETRACNLKARTEEERNLQIKFGLKNSIKNKYKKDSPKKNITRKRKSVKINDRTTNSNSAKNTKRKMVKKRKQNTDELPIPVENEDGRVQCQQCESVLDNIKLWNEHVQQHQPKETPKRKYIKKSDKIKKEQLNQKEYKCEHCGKGFASISYYRIHKRIHSGDQPFLCTECGKGFKVNSSLYTHMLRHKGVKKYQCSYCPKKFVCSSGLYGHMLVHTNKKSFVCDICGSAFRMAYELKKHNRYHNGIKSFECEYCDKKFITREKQLRHMRTHTGEKPYRCKYCERAFAQSNDCVKHLRQHLGDNVYQCELCPLRFPLARDLRAHFATHRGDDEETRACNLKARTEEERNLQIKFGLKNLIKNK